MTDDREELELELMNAQIEALKAERVKHEAEADRLRQEIRMENRKFLLQVVVALIAALGVGVAIGRFWLFHA